MQGPSQYKARARIAHAGTPRQHHLERRNSL